MDQPPPPPPPHAVNSMAMAPQPMSMPMGMQQAMSMPMSAGTNPLAMGMAPTSAYGVAPPSQIMMLNGMSAPQMAALNAQQHQQQQMNIKMGQMGGAINPAMQMAGGAAATGGPQGMGNTDWRIQLTREHRANLIAKMYVSLITSLWR